MARDELSLPETVEMFLHVCRRMEENKEMLTRADQAIGDGDHGIGMARGFQAAGEKLRATPFANLDELLKAIGLALLNSIGGASGAVFGTFFLSGGKGLTGRQTFDSAALARLLADGLQAVQQRGKAPLGSKTMVDALAPAAAKAANMATAPLGEALAAVAEAAREGMEASKGLVATVGKAKSLGERSLGFADPGAVSTYLILKSMAEYVTA